MARLTTKERKGLPKSDFGEPGKRAYPMPDKGHAKDAKARASQAVNAGRMSKSAESKIDDKADKKLGEKKSPPVKKMTRAQDDRYDKKHGIKEGSAADKKLDKERGLKPMVTKKRK